MADERDQRYSRSYGAAVVASVGTVVAAVVGYLTNVLTSSWSWALFSALAALVAVAAVLPFAAEKIERQRQRQAEELRLRAERRAAVAGRDRERVAALRSHFQSRAQGLTPSWSRREWYFTGRERVLSEIVDWMAVPDSDIRVRVITGGPGSGKSAVLGRIVTFVLPALRAGVPVQELARAGPGVIPPAGSIHSAVSAQGRTVDQVAAAIGEDMGLTASTASELLAGLHDRRRGEPAVVVVDAVDEAAEPGRLIYELLEPLASASRRTGVRLLAGMRPGLNRHLVRQFGPEAAEMDLDSTAYWDQRDVAAYVRRCLLAEDEQDLPTPYRGQPELARRVADAVAASAGRSFLIAQLTGFALAAAPAVTDPELTGGQRRFPDNVGAAMDEYLVRFAADRRRVRDLLLPLAWAEGDGLADRRAWAQLATELGTGSYTGQDITWLLRDTSAADLLQRTERDGEARYRLFHAALSEHLRAVSEAEHPAADIQRRFAKGLIGLVPSDEQGLNWLHADSYTRAYLATHAAAGGVLDGLAQDTRFLVAAGPDRLLPALQTCQSGRAQAIAGVVERIGSPFLRSAVGERASYLEMSARKHGEIELADAVAALPVERPWSLPWAHWAEGDQLIRGKTVGQHPGYVVGVAVTSADDQPCVVSASKWAVQMRRLADATPTGPAIQDWPAPIEAIAVTEGPEPVLVTRHENGQIRRWDLAAGAPVGDETEPGNISRNDWGMSPVIRYRDRELLVTKSGESGDSVQLIDVATGEQIGDSLIVANLEHILAVKVIGDRLLLLAGVKGCQAGVWDVPAQSPVAEPFAPFGVKNVDERYSAIWCGDLAEYDGRVIAVLGGGVNLPMDSRIAVWDVASREAIGGDLTGHRFGVMAMKVESTDTRQTICTGGGDGTVRCWLWPQGDLNGEPIFAHAGGADYIATVQTDGQLTVISAGRDGAVRAWDLGLIRSAQPDPDATVRELVCSSPNGQEIVTGITGGGQSMTTWNSTTGQKIIDWDVGGGSTSAVGVDISGQTLIATSGHEADIRIWNPTSGQLEMSLHLPEGTDITSLAACNAGGQSFLAAVSTDGRLHVWDVAARTPLYAPIACGLTYAHLAIESIDDMPHIVTSSRSDDRPCLWNLATGERSNTILQPRQHDDNVNIASLAVGNFDSKPVAVAISGGGRCCAWDLRDGTLLLDSELDDGHGMALWCVTIGNLKGRNVIVSSGYAGAVTLWNLDASIAQIIETGSPVYSLAIDARKRIICGGIMGTLAIEIT
jgi:WD40 repeat protein